MPKEISRVRASLSNDKKKLFILDSSVISELVILGIIEKLDDYRKMLHAEIILPTLVQDELYNDNKVYSVLKSYIEKGSFKVVKPPEKIVKELRFRFFGLGDGEIGVLALAIVNQKEHTSMVIPLMDDKKARKAARELGLPVHGTLWLLIEFARKRLIGKHIALNLLRMLPEHGFRLSEEILRAAKRKIQEIL